MTAAELYIPQLSKNIEVCLKRISKSLNDRLSLDDVNTYYRKLEKKVDDSFVVIVKTIVSIAIICLVLAFFPWASTDVNGTFLIVALLVFGSLLLLVPLLTVGLNANFILMAGGTVLAVSLEVVVGLLNKIGKGKAIGGVGLLMAMHGALVAYQSSPFSYIWRTLIGWANQNVQ